ncbi:hypothetical protein ABN110_22685 [Escherichia coli]
MKYTPVGVDIAKHLIQVHFIDYGGRPVLQFSCSGDRCTAVKK